MRLKGPKLTPASPTRRKSTDDVWLARTAATIQSREDFEQVLSLVPPEKRAEIKDRMMPLLRAGVLA